MVEMWRWEKDAREVGNNNIGTYMTAAASSITAAASSHPVNMTMKSSMMSFEE